MFANTIIDSDAFLEMPIMSQLLYFHMGVASADKGIVNNSKRLCKSVGIPAINIEILHNKGFIEYIEEIGIAKITHWDINNGISETAKKRLSYEYRKWRSAVLERDNHTCRECGTNEKVMHVHHILPFATYPESRYIVANGVTLCPMCHREEHRKEVSDG